MSGDVQPRKRKDKKRKKDETAEEIIHHAVVAQTAPPSDDVNIHVHKERSTGGGFCAKFIFFILLAVLAVLLGLIITEHRGVTDLDLATTESRFSHIFDGWIDDSPAHDDHEDVVSPSKEEESHEDDDDEEHAASDEDDHQEDEEEQKSIASEEDEEEEEEEQTYEQETVENTDEDEDEQQTIEEDDDEDENSQEETIEETYEQESEEQEDENDDDDNEIDEQSVEKLSQEEDSEEDKTLEDDNNNEEEDKDDTTKDSKETLDEAEKDEDEDKSEETAEPIEENVEQASSGVVKVGVGVFLLVVAYVVLVKKWKTDRVSETITPEKEIIQETIPDLSRRKTLVAPPTLEQVEQELESAEEDYSEEERDADSEDDVKLAPSTKRQYQELRTTYSRSLSNESDAEKSPSDEEYEREHEIDYDDERESEESDEEENKDLMKRLDEKYGIIQHNDDQEEAEDEAEDEEEGEEEGEEEDEEEDEQGDYDDYEHLESWKRTKEKNDADSDDDQNWPREKSGAQAAYDYSNITNSDDWEIRNDLDDAHERLHNAADALVLFNYILEKYPKSPRALYGKAQALDSSADNKKSNQLLQEAIAAYMKVLHAENVPAALFRAAAERCINRMRFIGHYSRAVSVHKLLINKFPDGPEYPNQLAVTYLTINKIQEAKLLLYNVLSKWPNDGFALVHYGFILKTNDNNLKDAVFYLNKGIQSKAPGVIDGRFYFHLGDALARLGHIDNATKVYEEGVANNIFLSKYQRSLYNIKRLTGKPWWNIENFPKTYQDFFNLLKNNWKTIRDEGLLALNKKSNFKDESENLKDIGDWKQYELFARGIKHVENCKKCPFTCKIVQTFSDSWNCRRGQVKFSVMHPGTHVWPHCGPTNCRLRAHLGLKVPLHTYIRVAEETKSWQEGDVFIFDDSFEHEVWHNGSDFRLVLIVDVWHPEITPREKASLSAI